MLHFLAVDAETGRPRHPALTEGELEEIARSNAAPERGPGVTIAPGRLEEAGWGVVFAHGTDDAVRRALEPLLERRRTQAGELYGQWSYVRRRGRGAFESRLRTAPGPTNPRRLPYYLLLVGDPTEIPHGFQFGLDAQHAVGRLSFERPEDYARYAESVVAAETASPHPAPRLALFGFAHDDDPATDECLEHLVEPLTRNLERRFTGNGQGGPIELFTRERASRERLLEGLADPRSPLIFTAGHAVCYVPGHPDQPRRQGALVCSDWPGHAAGAPTAEQVVEARSLPPGSGLRGKILFHFGCYTAGTPERDSFDTAPRPEDRPQIAERPFVADLPRALLAHPGGGALAVVGHVDRAFPSAFRWHDFHQSEIFEEALAALLSGHPVGHALDGFGQRYADLARRAWEAETHPGDGEADAPPASHVWTAANDARGYVILGDPAVRLPGAG